MVPREDKSENSFYSFAKTARLTILRRNWQAQRASRLMQGAEQRLGFVPWNIAARDRANLIPCG